MGLIKQKENPITIEQAELVNKMEVLTSLHRKGKLKKTGHENLLRYREKLDKTGYDWNSRGMMPTRYTLRLLVGRKRKWVLN